jgi:hypothetical protein
MRCFNLPTSISLITNGRDTLMKFAALTVENSRFDGIKVIGRPSLIAPRSCPIDRKAVGGKAMGLKSPSV